MCEEELDTPRIYWNENSRGYPVYDTGPIFGSYIKSKDDESDDSDLLDILWD